MAAKTYTFVKIFLGSVGWVLSRLSLLLVMFRRDGTNRHGGAGLWNSLPTELRLTQPLSVFKPSGYSLRRPYIQYSITMHIKQCFDRQLHGHVSKSTKLQ